MHVKEKEEEEEKKKELKEQLSQAETMLYINYNPTTPELVTSSVVKKDLLADIEEIKCKMSTWNWKHHVHSS